MKRVFATAAVLSLALAACRPIEFEDNWMDSPTTADPAVEDPDFQVSTRFPAPTPEQLATPVIVAGHGWGGSSFDFFDFNDHLEASEANVLLSRVTLGGHGTDVFDFEASTWESWQQPLVDEYNALRGLGYEKIFMLTTSTSGTLAIMALADGLYDDEQGPDGYYMIAPLVIPENKDVFNCWWIGWALGSSEAGVDLMNRETGELERNELTEAEKEMFYVNLPIPPICEIATLSDEFKGRLKDGIEVPAGVRVKAVRSDLDATVDPVSYEHLEDGLRGDDVELLTDEGRFHVFIRLVGRREVLEEETQRALDTFDDIVDFVTAP